MSPLFDGPSLRAMKLQQEGGPEVERVRKLIRAGATGREIAKQTGWYQQLVSRFKQLEDPTSALSLRVKQWRADKVARAEAKQQQQAQRLHARDVRKKMAQLKREQPNPELQYEQFLARERGELEPGRRIPLLDYEEEDQQATDTNLKRAFRQRFRQLSRVELPVDERVRILIKHARSEDPGISMKALHELHAIEGAIKKPTEAKSTGTGVPLFSLPGGLPIQVAPVGQNEPEPS